LIHLKAGQFDDVISMPMNWSTVMNSSMCRADATTHVKIVATALLAAIVVVWIGIAARLSPTATASVGVPARPSTVLVRLSPALTQPSMVAMVERHRM
jgi:hypothetical protein